MIMHTRMSARRAGSGTDITFRGELVPSSSREPDDPNRDLVVTEYRVLLPRHIDLTAHDTVTVLGKEYEFEGEPMPILIRGHVHHYEGRVRRVTG